MHHDQDGRDGGRRDGGRDGGGPGGGGGGAQGTEFLDLEISQVLLGEAQQMAKGVALDLIRESIRDRLRERLGDRLAEVGRLAADELADDVEANLAIEAQIAQRNARASGVQERLAAAMKGSSKAKAAPRKRR